MIAALALAAGFLAGLIVWFPMGRAYGRSEGERAERRARRDRTLSDLRAESERRRALYGYGATWE